MAGLDARRRRRPFGPLGIEIGNFLNVVWVPLASHRTPCRGEVLDEFLSVVAHGRGFREH